MTTTTPAVIPTTSIKLEVSSAPVTVTNSQGVVSVSVVSSFSTASLVLEELRYLIGSSTFILRFQQVQTVSVAVAGNVASNLNTSSSSSPPIGYMLFSHLLRLESLIELVFFISQTHRWRSRRRTSHHRLSHRILHSKKDQEEQGCSSTRRG